ncbi:hypothetical protein NC651_026299 [Populus alba x Populus x berolinensis]|nr:hypothetical protein NC651_026299 [Populus alba x Populus x berolinensis]
MGATLLWVIIKASLIETVHIQNSQVSTQVLQNFRATLVYAGKKSNTARIIVITVLPAVGAVILVICVCLFIRTRKQREKERIEKNVAERPTMASVVLMLSSSSLTLQIPSHPAFFMNSSTYQSDLSSSMGHNSRVTESSLSESEAMIPLSKNEVSITELYPR